MARTGADAERPWTVRVQVHSIRSKWRGSAFDRRLLLHARVSRTLRIHITKKGIRRREPIAGRTHHAGIAKAAIFCHP